MSVTVYSNDFGQLVLNPRDIKSAENFAEVMQGIYWGVAEDDMVGIPEVDPRCNIITQSWDARIQAEYERHGRFW